jgi:hypothetical protein
MMVSLPHDDTDDELRFHLGVVRLKLRFLQPNVTGIFSSDRKCAARRGYVFGKATPKDERGD